MSITKADLKAIRGPIDRLSGLVYQPLLASERTEFFDDFDYTAIESGRRQIIANLSNPENNPQSVVNALHIEYDRLRVSITSLFRITFTLWLTELADNETKEESRTTLVENIRDVLNLIKVLGITHKHTSILQTAVIYTPRAAEALYVAKQLYEGISENGFDSIKHEEIFEVIKKLTSVESIDLEEDAELVIQAVHGSHLKYDENNCVILRQVK